MTFQPFSGSMLRVKYATKGVVMMAILPQKLYNSILGFGGASCKGISSGIGLVLPIQALYTS